MENQYRIFLLILLALIPWIQSGAQDSPVVSCYHVDRNNPLASNSNPGSSTMPWLTIQHALDVALPGDSIVIRNGIYYESLITTRSGDSLGGCIVLSAYPGEQVVVDGTGHNSNTGFRIYHSRIIIRNLEIRNWENTGIWVLNASFFGIHDCEIHQMRFGIGISGNSHDFLLTGNVIHHFDYYGIDISPMGGDFCYNGTIIGCTAHTCRDTLQNVDGFALGHGVQHSFLFQDCHAFGVYDGFDISAAQTVLKNCRADHCSNTCYKLWAHQVELVNCIGFRGNISVVQLGWTGTPDRTTIRNCSFYDAGVYTIWQANSQDTLVIHNSIISGGENIGLCFEEPSAANYYGNHNVFQNQDTSRAINVGWSEWFSTTDIQQGLWFQYSDQDSNSTATFFADEIFIYPDTNNLHIRPDGPAFDMGSPVWSPPDDYDGLPRPIGANPDVGAFEYQFFGTVVLLGNLLITNDSSHCYAATRILTLGGINAPVTVLPEAMVSFEAGQQIFLKEGTHFTTGSNVWAVIRQPAALCNPTLQPSSVVASGNVNMEDGLNFPAQDNAGCNIMLCPNPGSGLFIVMKRDFRMDDSFLVSIYNAKGALVQRKVAKEMTDMTFDLTHVAPGIYLVVISSGQNQSIQRLIKQ